MATQMTDTTPAEQVDAIAYEIAEKGLALDRANEEIGKAYARQRKGDKKAASDIGKLAAKRAKLEAEMHDFKLTQRAITEQIEADREVEEECRRAALDDDLKRITAEARTLEKQLGEQVIAAGETARQLQAAEQAWQRARAAAGKAGVPVHEKHYGPRPAPAAGLVRPNVIDEPERTVLLWRNQYIEKTAIPPRTLTGMEAARKQEAAAVNAAMEAERARKREQESGSPSFTILDAMREKMRQGVRA